MIEEKSGERDREGNKRESVGERERGGERERAKLTQSYCFKLNYVPHEGVKGVDCHMGWSIYQDWIFGLH